MSNPCPYCNQAMTLGDGSYWCMNKRCAEQFYSGENEYLARVRLDTMPEVEIVYMPRSEWPQSVRDLLDKAHAEAEAHSVQFCRDATMLGEGCPIDQCRCTCHDPEGD